MGKAKLAVVLGAAYALGTVGLVGVALALPCGTLPKVRSALDRVPVAIQHVALVARAAVHAGSLGVKHLPTVLEPQGGFTRKHLSNFCLRDSALPCESALSPLPSPSVVLGKVMPFLVVDLRMQDDEG